MIATCIAFHGILGADTLILSKCIPLKNYQQLKMANDFRVATFPYRTTFSVKKQKITTGLVILLAWAMEMYYTSSVALVTMAIVYLEI